MEEENLGSSELTTTDESITQAEPTDAAGQPIEIDSPDRYLYKGRPINEWESGYMRQSDYTQKTQAMAQERKFYDNLSYDLDKVREQPALAEQFKQIYPEKFHAYLRYVLQESNAQRSQGQTQQQQYAQIDPRLQARIDQLESNYRKKEVEAISAEIEHKFQALSKKYPFADEEAVLARASALLNKLKEQDPTNPDLKITDKQWDLLWKSQHERAEQLAEARHKEKVNKQLQAHKTGADTGKGGGIPGQAPRQFKTIKEATAQAISDFESGAI